MLQLERKRVEFVVEQLRKELVAAQTAVEIVEAFWL
jgi:hypothetical protein